MLIKKSVIYLLHQTITNKKNIMKKSVLLLFAVLFISCSTDDSDINCKWETKNVQQNVQGQTVITLQNTCTGEIEYKIF